MEQQLNPIIVSEATETLRASFYRKTYTHLAIALVAFVLVETLLLKFVPQEWIFFMLGGKWIWLFIIGLMWVGTSLSNNLAFHPNKEKQYLGLGLYILLEAIIFMPLIYLAIIYSNNMNVVYQAALLTLFMFVGLTVTVFLSNKDFSFLRSIIVVGGFVALGIIVVGAIFDFELGMWFSSAMILLASAGILYQTHQIKNVFTTNQYVGASLQLFSSILFLFWYVLRLLMSSRD